MARRPILTWPDPRLTESCATVPQVTDAVRGLSEDLLDTMYAAPGRGLAAPQVGEMVCLFVMDTTWKEGTPTPRVFVNPVIEVASSEIAEAEEGCLSIPGILANVRRPASVRLRWTNLDGGEASETFHGFAATCVQHELDHLDGIVTFDRVDPAQRQALVARYAG